MNSISFATLNALRSFKSSSNAIITPQTFWPSSASSSFTYPIYLRICPTTLSLARPRFNSTTSKVLWSLLIAKISSGPVSEGYC